MMSAARHEDLRRLYVLLRRVRSLDTLKVHFIAYVKARGLQMVQDRENESSLVKQLLAFKTALDVAVRTAFDESEMFDYAIKVRNVHTFTYTSSHSRRTLSSMSSIQMRIVLLSSLVRSGYDVIDLSYLHVCSAKFVDSLLRSGRKGISEDETEALLDEVMVLFRCVSICCWYVCD
jgi:hypothetical protein